MYVYYMLTESYGVQWTAEFLFDIHLWPANAAKWAPSAPAASMWSWHTYCSVVFIVATPGIKVERIKGIVKCPLHPRLLPSEKRRPLSLHGFYNPYSFIWLWCALAFDGVVLMGSSCVSELASVCCCGCALGPCRMSMYSMCGCSDQRRRTNTAVWS